MKKVNFKAIIAAILVCASLFALSGCVTANVLYSDDNRYVSVYVYGKDGSRKWYIDAVRVVAEPASTETNADGDPVQPIYRESCNGLLALELAATEKDLASPIIEMYNYTGTPEYHLVDINGISVAEEESNGDQYKWVFKINGVEADPATAEIKNHDLLSFHCIEETFRTFRVTFDASFGAVDVFSGKEFAYAGEKADMNLAYYLDGKYEDYENPGSFIDIDKSLGITLSEDGKSITKIGSYENSDTHKWGAVMIETIEPDEDDLEAEPVEVEVIYYDLSEITVTYTMNIHFEYIEQEVEETEADTAEDTAEDEAAE